MRKINRREESYTPQAATSARRTGNWIHRVYIETEIKAAAWSKAHRGKSMGAIQWNCLWERERDRIYGESWACECKHGYAREAVCR